MSELQFDGERGSSVNAWKTHPPPKIEKTCFSPTNSTNNKEVQSLVWNMKVWNPSISFSEPNDIKEKIQDDYKISSSLKTIWSDMSESKPSSSDKQSFRLEIGARKDVDVSQSPQSEYPTNKVIPGGFGNMKKIVKNTGRITSQNGNRGSKNSLTNDVGNVHSGQNFVAPMSLPNYLIQPTLTSFPGTESSEEFMRKLQLIVENGFLDPKILTEPVSSDTLDLIQMLIFYVMEYSKTKNYAKSTVISPDLYADINTLVYKINLIRNEIAKCQSQFLEARRARQELWDSYVMKNRVNVQTNKQSSLDHFKMPVKPGEYNRFTAPIDSSSSSSTFFRPTSSSKFGAGGDFQNQIFDKNMGREKDKNLRIKFLSKSKNYEHRLSAEQDENDLSQKNCRLFQGSLGSYSTSN